jgi:AraC-like DNA-binding protein
MTPPRPLASSLPLAFGNGQARVNHDPDALATQLRQSVPLRDLSPLPSSGSFVHRAVHVRASQLVITAAAHSPLRGANHSQAKAVFTLPIMGEKRFGVAGRPYRARAGHSALYLPGEAYSLETTTCSGVMFSVCPLDLAAVGNAMAGPRADHPCLPMERPVLLLESHPRQGNLLALLRRSLRLIDLVSRSGPTLPGHLGLDDKVMRLLALLLYPQLTAPATDAAPTGGPEEAQAFDALLDALRHDLHGAWTLTRMERQAALSRPSLRRHFQVHFGCGPLEWLRHQRLCWARQLLDGPLPFPLSELALRCGYGDLAEFRSAFEHQFHLPPESLVLKTLGG